MEWLVGIMFLGGIGLFLWQGSRVGALEEKVTVLDRELRLMHIRIGRLKGTDLAEPRAATVAVSSPAAEPEPVLAPATLTAALEPIQAAAEDALPPAGMAALMAADLAARSKGQRTGPSAFSRWLARARGTDEWEALIGGNWLNRIGALALILGIGFFLKYAFDNNWITQSARVGLGVAVGIGLLALARRTHGQGYAIFAQGLVGAGLGILYLSVYASYNFYALVPAPAAFVALGLVVALGFSQALYYDSPTVALLAWGGGFLTPFLLGSGAATPAGVTAYVVLLDAGILAIVLKKPAWAVLEALSLAATYVVYLSWFFVSYNESYLLTAGIALTLFWLVFHALDVWLIGHTRPDIRHLHTTTAAANAVAYYGLMFALLFPSHRAALGLISLAIGVVYVATILTVRGPLREGAALDARFTVTAIVLLAVATALLTSGFTTVALWSLESVALLWAGSRWNLSYVWQPALALFGTAAVWLAATPGALAAASPGSFMPVFNLRFLGFAALAAALAAGTVPARTLRDRAAPHIWTSLHFGWCGVVLVLLTVESNDAFRRAMEGASGDTLTFLGYARFLALAAVWVLYSLPLVWFGMRRQVLPWVISGLGSAALGSGWAAAVGVAYQPVREFMPALNVRAGLLVLVMAVLAVQLRWVRGLGERYAWADTVRMVIPVALVLLGFELVTAEINDSFARAAGRATQTTHDVGLLVEIAALGTAWMLYSLFLVWGGLRRASQAVLVIGLSSAGLSVGAGVYCGFVPQPDARLPLALGLRAGMLPLILIGLFLHLRLLKDATRLYRWLDGVLAAFQAAIVLLGFELLTGETRDYFDYLASSSSTAPTGSSHLRNLEQLTLSALWLLYAGVLMAVGLWRRTRWMRLGSIALLGFIILKVFVYDLSFLSGLYRSASFAALGAILLLVSYLYSRYRELLLQI